jgi:hypothetical protein
VQLEVGGEGRENRFARTGIALPTALAANASGFHSLEQRLL